MVSHFIIDNIITILDRREQGVLRVIELHLNTEIFEIQYWNINNVILINISLCNKFERQFIR